MGHILHLLRGHAIRFRENRRASVFIEVAITAPLILFVFMATFETARFALLQMKVSRTAMNMADLVAQAEKLSEDDLNGLFAAVQHIGKPFSFNASNTMLIVSSVGLDTNDDPIVNWQREGIGSLGQTSQIGSEGSDAELPDDFEMQTGDTAIAVEMYYEFEPVIFDTIIDAQRLSNVAIYRPRLASLDMLESN